MSIYHRNLRRLGLGLIVVSILDAIVQLFIGRLLQGAGSIFVNRMQMPVGICIKDAAGLLTGLLACHLYRSKDYSHGIIHAEVLLLIATVCVILVTARGQMVNRVDGLIDATLLMMIMVVYTMLQLRRGDRIWQRIHNLPPAVLDLKLKASSQWFNPIEIGPKLELSDEISSVVNRFLETARTSVPLQITVQCPDHISELLGDTMREVFHMYYEDEERRVNHYLEGRYVRAMALAAISIIGMTIWINFSPSTDKGVTWTILSNFAAFSLWQIGNTYFERSGGYAELLRVMIAKQAEIQFSE